VGEVLAVDEDLLEEVVLALHPASFLEDVLDHHHRAALEQVEGGAREQVQDLRRMVVDRLVRQQHAGRHVDDARGHTVGRVRTERFDQAHHLVGETGGHTLRRHPFRLLQPSCS
jgi:hypothetical protein